MKKYSFEEIKDKYIGKLESLFRKIYEFELKLELIGEVIKKIRKERDLI